VRLPDKDLLRRLVGFDSVSSASNAPIADFVCEYLDRPGVEIVRDGGPDGTKVNVVAIAPRGAAGPRGLAFSGHLDVVPAGEPGWTSDPFTLTEAAGNLVGRGACDMKGSIALAMNLFAGADHRRLRQPLALLLTCDEELGSLGAQRLARDWPAERPLPSSVVVGEPTGLRAVRMHKGHMTMRVTVEGRSAHTGTPHLGQNALEAAGAVVVALSKLGDLFRQKRADSSRYFSSVPFPVLAVTRISGGTAVNVVPDRCTVDLGVRLLPGMNTAAAVEWVRDTAVKSRPEATIGVEVSNDNPPMLLAENAPIHSALCSLLGQTQSYGVGYASDAGVLAAMGLDCVLFGPGSIEVAHKPGEYLAVSEFEKARPLLERLVERFCHV
jgi:acetylornithine deacetylase